MMKEIQIIFLSPPLPYAQTSCSDNAFSFSPLLPWLPYPAINTIRCIPSQPKPYLFVRNQNRCCWPAPLPCRRNIKPRRFPFFPFPFPFRKSLFLFYSYLQGIRTYSVAGACSVAVEQKEEADYNRVCALVAQPNPCRVNIAVPSDTDHRRPALLTFGLA